MNRAGVVHFDVAQLERSLDQARQAFACAFSTSDEFEAAIIQERRAAGCYGRRPYPWLAVIAAISVLFAILLAI